MRKTPLQRVLALMLALMMICSLAPVQVFAAGTTIAGDPVTVKAAQDAAASRENNFNKDWKFYLGDNSSASSQNFDDSGWEDVDLPHDFSITQHFTTSGEAESGFLPGGTGWYRKSFTLDNTAEGKTFLLNFDGVYMHAYVYVNGTFVGEHHYGYTSFAFDITDHLVCDGVTENVVAVKAVNNLPSSRWYSGSGIYRDVTLYAMESVHVDLNGVTVTTPNIASGDGTASVETTLVNDGASAVNATVTSTIYAKGTETALATASASVSVPAGSTAAAQTAPVVSSPKLWSVEDPNLYTVVTEVTVNGNVVDTCETEFGYRWFEFNSSGFHLNGKAVKLNGVCMHHDQGGLGAAAYYDAMYRQISIMKDMGCNAIRTSHNPADEQFIAICNELGMLVIEEVFDGITQSKNGNSNDFCRYFATEVDANLYGAEEGMICAEYATRSIVKRDRNAPSVFAWSYGNEIQEGNYVNSADYETYCKAFISWINDEDGTRIATIGDNTKASGYSYVNAALSAILEAGGVVGFNYHCHQANSQSLVNNWGGQWGCIIASETSSHVNSRGFYKNQASASTAYGYHLTSYDTSAVHWGDNAHDSMYDTLTKDYIAGEFVWTGFDYIGEPTPWNGTDMGYTPGNGATPNSSYFGIVETTGFEKDTYYLYRSQWNKDATTVHLVTAWDSDNMMTSGGKTPVWVYTNAPKVELYLNGQLIGTTERTVNTTAAGHTYNSYTATSNDTAVCTVSNGSGADALYSVFNVAYTAGTLTAKAYDANGKEITLNDSMGRYTVSTPGAVTKLNATVNKTEIAADGSSLAYIEVDVVDAEGNLDTTAANNITFTLSGPGEIAAVDNGDQATVRKYQNSYVLTSETTANIDAYAGKALVIVRSTEEAGTITLNIASDGLTGQTVTVNTKVENTAVTEGLVSYTMVRDYTVKAGTAPALDTAATGTLADGSTVNGTIAWNAVSAETYNTAGDYTITGTLTLSGFEGIPVSAKLHVIPNVVDLRNISAAVMEGTTPALPSTVRGVLADGTLAGEFTVNWKNIPDASAYDTVGEIVTITGTAAIFGEETMDVTCTVRVAEAVNTESINVAPMADSLSQDVPAGSQSDNLNSITDGNTNPGEDTNGRWTNWDNRYNSATAAITLTWATAQTLSDINLYYRLDNSCKHPEKIVFSYSLNGTEFFEVGAEESQMTDASVNYGSAYHYALEQVINPVALKVTFTQQNGTSSGYCVGLYEIECMTYAASFTMNGSADLSGITVDGTALPGFAADTLTYEAENGAVAAATAVNAGITVLPAYEGVVRVLTVSEDGTAARTYEITMAEETCAHANKEVRDEAAATCTEKGYTGDTWCNDCGELIESGAVIPATGHKNTVLQNTYAATCTENGYTGDTWCDDCQKIVSTGSVITSKGHAWDAGVITREPTEAEDGVKTFTCTVCGETKTEDVPYRSELKEPTVSLTLSKNKSTGKISMTGQVDDFENLEDYYEITAHGIIYIKSSRIGTRMLTLNTSGRTNVTFGSYTDTGAFTYTFKPTNKSTAYTYRAYVTYIDPETGKSVTVYSDMLKSSFNSIK